MIGARLFIVVVARPPRTGYSDLFYLSPVAVILHLSPPFLSWQPSVTWQ
jgi:hypothetical protein